MKPGTIVEWTPRYGTRVLQGVVLEYAPRRPLRKRGVPLGSWTDNFYRPFCLVAFLHESGRRGVQWIQEKKLRAKQLDEEARHRAELWILNY